jgi:hypothetical protein
MGLAGEGKGVEGTKIGGNKLLVNDHEQIHEPFKLSILTKNNMQRWKAVL